MSNIKHERILQECYSFLENSDMVITEPVKQVIEYFFLSEHHLSINDMVVFSKKNNLELSTDDVQNILDILVENGFAIQKFFGANEAKYEHLHLNEHHDHMYCVKCGKIIEFFSSGIEELQEVQANKNNFHIFTHKLLIKGLCDTCFDNTREKLIPLAMVQKGGMFQVVKIGRGENSVHCQFNKRVMEMGIIKGSVGEVLSNGSGGIVLNMNGNRLALRKGQSMKILVTLKN